MYLIITHLVLAGSGINSNSDHAIALLISWTSFTPPCSLDFSDLPIT